MFTFQWIIDGSFTDQFLLELNSFPIACNCIPQSHLGFIECFVLAVVGLNPANTMCKKSVSSVLRQVWLWEVLTTHSTYLKAICSSGRFVFLVVFIGMLSDTFTDLQHRSYFCRHLPKDILTQARIVLFFYFFFPHTSCKCKRTHMKKRHRLSSKISSSVWLPEQVPVDLLTSGWGLVSLLSLPFSDVSSLAGWFAGWLAGRKVTSTPTHPHLTIAHTNDIISRQI